LKQRDKDRFHSMKMADAYDKMCQHLVPGYDFMQEALINILKFEDIKELVLLDLGAGSGIFMEKILNNFPDSKCYYMDYSEDFMNIAKERLKKNNDRVTFIKYDFCGKWESKLKENPNVITSCSAIHHLSNENKKKLYKKCYNTLEENGWLFNIDEMKPINEDAYIKSLYYWIYHVNMKKNQLSEDEMNAFEKWMEQFDNWKKRNVYNINKPKKEGDDIHELFIEQLDWLKEIGFRETDIFSKHFLWCLIGGKKTF